MKACGNRLVDTLPHIDRQRLLNVADSVALTLSQMLGKAGAATRQVYFPVDSFISLIAVVDAHPGLAVGMIGSEGMLGAHVALGLHHDPLMALVQGQGTALRMDIDPFRHELARSAALRRVLNRYVYVQMAQRTHAAGCLRYHQIGPRLARWLMMSQDRADSAHFHVTHEFLAYMLGVRREGITAAAGALQHEGWIHYRRGEVSILDRAALATAACSCYDADLRVYDSVMC